MASFNYQNERHRPYSIILEDDPEKPFCGKPDPSGWFKEYMNSRRAFIGFSKANISPVYTESEIIISCRRR
jgi:hypothetical protein